jgi:hypothetical protein
MRYLLTLLLTLNFACGEETARPRTKDTEVDIEVEGAEKDMGCNTIDCMSEDELRDKLLNLLHPKDHGIYRDHFEFEAEPFEFDSDYGYGGHQS